MLSWTAGTVLSAVVGLVVGAIIVAILHVIPRRKKDATAH